MASGCFCSECKLVYKSKRKVYNVSRVTGTCRLVKANKIALSRFLPEHISLFLKP